MALSQFCSCALSQVMTYNSGLFIAVLIGGERPVLSGLGLQFVNEIAAQHSTSVICFVIVNLRDVLPPCVVLGFDAASHNLVLVPSNDHPILCRAAVLPYPAFDDAHRIFA